MSRHVALAVRGASFALLSALAPVTSAQQARSSAPSSEASLAIGDPGTVIATLVLNDAKDPFERTLGEHDEFGSALAFLGDLNGDGNLEYAIGAPGDFQSRGAVWMFSLTPTRQLAGFVKLGPLENMPLDLDVGDRFGNAVVAVGDLNGDGVGDVAVGAPGDDDGLAPPFTNSGAVYLLFLGPDGLIVDHRKFSRTAGGLPAPLAAGDVFGSALASLGDLDGNGTADLAVGTPGDNDGGNSRGAVWILRFAADQSLLGTQKISDTQGGFGGLLDNGDGLGASLASMGDLSGDGTLELATGTSSVSSGDVWMLSLASDGTVVSEILTRSSTNFRADALANLGDLDGDGVTDLAVGAPGSMFAIGEVVIVRLNADGSIKASTAIPQSGVFGKFGAALAVPGDTDADGFADLLVGVPLWSQRAQTSGGLLVYDLTSTGTPASTPLLVDGTTSNLPVAPRFFEGTAERDYGTAIAPLGDLDEDGFPEVAVGSPLDDDRAIAAGAVWIHFLSPSGGQRVFKLSGSQVPLPLRAGDRFGAALAPLGDMDGNGIHDIAVGVPRDDEGGLDRGAIWIVFLLPNGGLADFQVISSVQGGFVGDPVFGFGSALTSIGDLDGDGVTEIVASNGQSSPKTWVLFLNADGTVKAQRLIDKTLVVGTVPNDAFGRAVSDYGRAPNGRRYLLVGTGPMWRVELDATGQVTGSVRTNLSTAVQSLAGIGDLDGDSVDDVAASHGNRVELLRMNANFSIKASSLYQGGREPRTMTAIGDATGDGVPDLAGTTAVAEGTSVFLAQLGGIAHQDFERWDLADQVRFENGQAVTQALTGRTYEISSAGANLGPAAFDSTPGGPNDPSQDRDLLVDSGKVLMLQDSLHPTQTEPGVFDAPNDDIDGGSFGFDLRRLGRPLSIKLIDIDPGFAQGALVRLIDDAGRTRTYDVPAGFTEDRVANGGSGWRTLDLTTLAPQPGFQASATAAQMVGFQAARVRRIEVELSSSGAIDDLVVDPYP